MRKRLLIAFMITAVVPVTFCSTAFAGQWVQDATRQENVNGVSNWRYRKNDGSYGKTNGLGLTEETELESSIALMKMGICMCPRPFF